MPLLITDDAQTHSRVHLLGFVRAWAGRKRGKRENFQLDARHMVNLIHAGGGKRPIFMTGYS